MDERRKRETYSSNIDVIKAIEEAEQGAGCAMGCAFLLVGIPITILLCIILKNNF